MYWIILGIGIITLCAVVIIGLLEISKNYYNPMPTMKNGNKWFADIKKAKTRRILK